MDATISDLSATHKRQYAYSYRLPTPPRVVVPPPSSASEIRSLQVREAHNDTAEEEPIDTSFLKDFNLTEGMQSNPVLAWKYAQRREAQAILPWLYLGPVNAAKDSTYLMREGITMTLAVRTNENAMKTAIQAGRQVCHEVATIEVPDSPALIRAFPRATRIITRHVAEIQRLTASTPNPRLGRVLVFCESGNEQSAAVVAAYLMEILDDFDFLRAMNLCQSQRFCVFFTDSIKTSLRSYWDIIQARRTVFGSRTTMPQSPRSPKGQPHQSASSAHHKRTIRDTMDDEDVDMEDGMDLDDVQRFSGRSIVPFSDG
ncbi:phosphatases II [Westerdykella ornata]|uniref:Phosphatases II n=1 Tax=Westerdykella ornata TaxID=318751 RepID=A0A6A6JW82_WESOR|nr:phosphatases II [Westerdykella ornata]KAF2279319.1 phosphatases II [Westerdykella ornata]